MLIVQFPSVLHEAGIDMIIHPFIGAYLASLPQHPYLATNLRIAKAKTNLYNENSRGRGSRFTSDGSIEVNGDAALHVEVAFSQTLRDVLRKAARLLKIESVLAVLVVDIQEDKQFKAPTSPPSRRDFVSRQQWLDRIRPYIAEHPFDRITVDEHVWMGKIEVNMHLLMKGVDGSQAGAPEQVRFPSLIP
jgi:hypothetical protein